MSKVSDRVTFEVKESEARALMAAVKAPVGAKDSPKRLATKLGSIDRWSSEVDPPEDPAMLELFNKLSRAAEDGDEVVVVPDAAPEEDGEGTAEVSGNGHAKKGGAPKKGKDKPAAKKDTDTKDKGAQKRDGDNRVMGYSACALGMAMGKAGWEFERARKAIDKQGLSLSDPVLKTALRWGRTGEKGTPAPLSDAELSKLEKAKVKK
jgi:hypothetical protein